MTCPTCHDDGSACFDCGSIDIPALGRKLGLLFRDDRPTLLRILAGTQRRHWPILAHAFLLHIGQPSPADVAGAPALTEPAILHLWSQLVKEAA